jgi:hypothetical protein
MENPHSEPALDEGIDINPVISLTNNGNLISPSMAIS